jgi:hypothetical protein
VDVSDWGAFADHSPSSVRRFRDGARLLRVSF